MEIVHQENIAKLDCLTVILFTINEIKESRSEEFLIRLLRMKLNGLLDPLGIYVGKFWVGTVPVAITVCKAYFHIYMQK